MAGQELDAFLLRAALARAHVPEPVVELVRDPDEHFDQIRDRAARRAEIGHEQDRVARGLVDLDAVAVHQVPLLECVTVDPGCADEQRHATRVEDELVEAPRPQHLCQSESERLVDAGRPVRAGNQVGGGHAVWNVCCNSLGRRVTPCSHVITSGPACAGTLYPCGRRRARGGRRASPRRSFAVRAPRLTSWPAWKSASPPSRRSRSRPRRCRPSRRCH